MSGAQIRVDRRPVTATDHDFLLELYASTRQAELAMVAWKPEQKRAFVESQFAAQNRGYADAFPAAMHEILTVDDEMVGRLYLEREPDQLHILDLTIAPAARNRGIGTQVLHEILAEADGAQKGVKIYVETFNRSQSLFARLGFQVQSQEGFNLLLDRPFAAVGSSS